MTSPTLCRALVAVLLLTANLAHAQIPQPLSYQGYLADSAGQALDDATTVTFALYAVETGGAPLWSDTQLIVPDQGLFAAELGSVSNPFPAGLFNTPLWLGVTISSDAEMTPRRALSSSAYAWKAGDAQSVGGQSAAALDQSDELNALASTVAGNDSEIALLDGQVTGLGNQLTSLDGVVDSNTANIGQLNTTVNTVSSDLSAVQTTLPTLQLRVNGACASGSAIRSISTSGSVTCEVDDAGPWLTNGLGQPWISSGGRVGLGTSAPAAALQIDSAVDTDPFRARVGSATKLRVHANGSVSVGSSSSGPVNGLFVSGSMAVGTTTPAARGTIADDIWQLSLDNNAAGGSEWFIGSSATAWAAGAGKLIFAPTNNSSSSAMTLTGAGNVGIDNNNPLARLHVSGGSDVTSSGGGFAIFGSNGSNQVAIDSNEIMARTGSGSGTLALNAEGGKVTVNSSGQVNDDTALEVTGQAIFRSGQNSSLVIGRTDSSPTNLQVASSLFEEGLIGGSSIPWWRVYSREFYASGPFEYLTYSDRSLKRNIKTIDNALDTIMQLDGVEYELMKHPYDTTDRALSEKEQFDRAHQLGFIAQDVETVLPQLVREDETSGLKTVGYLGVLPILVEAIKEQQRHIERQDARIAELEKRLQ